MIITTILSAVFMSVCLKIIKIKLEMNKENKALDRVFTIKEDQKKIEENPELK